jgi:hypothetical protein
MGNSTICLNRDSLLSRFVSIEVSEMGGDNPSSQRSTRDPGASHLAASWDKIPQPGNFRSTLYPKINWHNNSTGFPDAAWETAQHDNITELMPQTEVRADQVL